MEARQEQVKIRRIVVGLDIAPHSRWALEAAASLAGELDADLEALFVESDELHRLAGLPFAREMGFPSASLRPLDAGALERSLQARASEARHALTTLARPRALRWSFRVTRGSVPEELRTASAGADLTIVGIARWGREAMQFAQEATATVVVVTPSAALRGPLTAICRVGVAPEQAVTLVCALASTLGDGLTILVVGDDLARAGHWCEAAGEMFEKSGRKAHFEIVRDGQPEALQLALERLAPRVVAILAPALPGTP
jgi:nucleotide-binding universal stress UspA family protein